jgi:NUMOD4 motif
MVTEEVWRPVVGYEDAYLVSDRLRVRSVARTVARSDGRGQTIRERVLKDAVQSRTGLRQVTLSCEGRQRRVYVHRLAAEAFGDAWAGSATRACAEPRPRKPGGVPQSDLVIHGRIFGH